LIKLLMIVHSDVVSILPPLLLRLADSS
jgi:hypothetical protein